MSAFDQTADAVRARRGARAPPPQTIRGHGEPAAQAPSGVTPAFSAEPDRAQAPQGQCDAETHRVACPFPWPSDRPDIAASLGLRASDPPPPPDHSPGPRRGTGRQHHSKRRRNFWKFRRRSISRCGRPRSGITSSQHRPHSRAFARNQTGSPGKRPGLSTFLASSSSRLAPFQRSRTVRPPSG